MFFLLREIPKRFKPIDLDLALAQGEGQTIEFKSSFDYDVKERKHNSNLQIEVLASVVAFLNSNGGTVFVGVDDDGAVRGIAEDLHQRGGSTDDLQKALHVAIRDKIGPAYRGLVDCRFIPPVNPQVLALDVQPAPRSRPAFLSEYGPEFYFRQGSSSQKLNAEEQFKHFRIRP